MTYVEQLEVGIESTEEECWAKTGKAPMTTKWVRVNKGTSSKALTRARLVARDFKTKGGESVFAAMPPLEAKKLLCRMAAKEQCVWRRGKGKRRKPTFVDVSISTGRFLMTSSLSSSVWMERFGGLSDGCMVCGPQHKRGI